MGQSVEMGTIHASDYLVNLFLLFICDFSSLNDFLFSTSLLWIVLCIHLNDFCLRSIETFLFQSWNDQSSC